MPSPGIRERRAGSAAESVAEAAGCAARRRGRDGRRTAVEGERGGAGRSRPGTARRGCAAVRMTTFGEEIITRRSRCLVESAPVADLASQLRRLPARVARLAAFAPVRCGRQAGRTPSPGRTCPRSAVPGPGPRMGSRPGPRFPVGPAPRRSPSGGGVPGRAGPVRVSTHGDPVPECAVVRRPLPRGCVTARRRLRGAPPRTPCLGVCRRARPARVPGPAHSGPVRPPGPWSAGPPRTACRPGVPGGGALRPPRGVVTCRRMGWR
ncbi:hypothetical protein SAMN05421803_105254 [Nocardiopsis flavescens]|uniref:Uncharacterized protein n=1 Tax=Nocardiopsis flavescens TaxID=758803 RepID=A0A1M6IQ60_9ACTN|nr:hypothetical protein SAMN05421803_105254 [Nocardiopsis flavescens]